MPTAETAPQSVPRDLPLDHQGCTQDGKLLYLHPITWTPGALKQVSGSLGRCGEEFSCLYLGGSLRGTQGTPCQESACNASDAGSIPGLWRSPGEGKGYPLQYSGLENSMDCIVHGVAKSRTLLSNFHTIYIYIHTFFFRYILFYLYFLLLDYMFFYIYENIYIFFFRSFSIICIFKDFFEMDHF